MRAPPPSVGASALFVGFLKIGLSGFGGVLPFARRMIVDKEQWLTEHEFLDVLSLSQFLPGPNIVNVSIVVGRRFAGVRGAIAAFAGLMLMPLIIVLALATLYAEVAQIAAVRGALSGISASASGLVLATALKLSRPLKHRPWQIAICVIAFVAIALLRAPLFWTLLVLCPLSIATAWWRRA